MHNDDPDRELKSILDEAVRSNTNVGSSTAVLLKFDTSQKNMITTTNLGDSAYIHFRPQKDGELELMFRSKE